MSKREPEIFGPVMEIECDKCKKPVMILQLTPSVLSFKCKCHRCGEVMEGENFSHTGHPAKIEDEYYREWQNKNT